MHVYVIDALTRVRAAVHDQPVTGVGHAQLAGELARDHEKFAHHVHIAGRQMIHSGDMPTGNDQDVYRRAWVDVMKCYRVVVLVGELGRDRAPRDSGKSSLRALGG